MMALSRSPVSILLVANFLILILVRITSCVRRFFRQDLRHVPGPFFAKFTGLSRLAMVARGQGPERYRKLHQKYGHIVRVGPNHVSISEPSCIPHIYGLGSKFSKTEFYVTMVPSYDGQTVDSMFTARDPAIHKALKTPVASLFAMTNMRDYEPYVDECTEIFVDTMSRMEGQVFDLATWLQWYAFDVIASVTFQRRFGFMEQKKDVGHMIAGLDIGLNVVKVLGQYPGADGPFKTVTRHLLALFGQYDPLIKFVDICKDEIVRYDSSSKVEGRTDFLSQLRQREEKLVNSNPKASSDLEILNHLSNNLLAGSDTTAISLRACFYYLIKTPRVLNSLRAEIDDYTARDPNASPFTLNASLEMPYLQAVIKEATRLHPGVGFTLERYVPTDCTVLCGVALSAGTNVSMTAPVVQMDPLVFGQDVQDFRPERWLEADAERTKLMERSMLVFGHGARTCIGKNISIMEMGKLIPRIIHAFDIEWASDRKHWKTNAAWFWKQTDMHVIFGRRRRQ